MRDVHIRKAGPQDARAISTLHTRSFRTAYERFLRTRRSLDTGDRRRTAFWEKLLDRQNETTLLAIGDDAVVGFIRFGPSPDDDADENTGHVFSVHVDPDLTGSGVGSQLVEAAMVAMSQGCQAATLWALSENEAAHRFYERLGWHKDGVVRTEKLSIGDDDGDEVEVIRFHVDLVAVVERAE